MVERVEMELKRIQADLKLLVMKQSQTMTALKRLPKEEKIERLKKLSKNYLRNPILRCKRIALPTISNFSEFYDS